MIQPEGDRIPVLELTERDLIGLEAFEEEQQMGPERVEPETDLIPTRRVYISHPLTGALTRKPHRHSSFDEEVAKEKRTKRMIYVKRIKNPFGTLLKSIFLQFLPGNVKLPN